MLAAVVGMQDHAKIADGPAMLRVDKPDILNRASSGWIWRAGGSALGEDGEGYSGARILRFGFDDAVPPGDWAIP